MCQAYRKLRTACSYGYSLHHFSHAYLTLISAAVFLFDFLLEALPGVPAAVGDFESAALCSTSTVLESFCRKQSYDQ